MKKRQPGCSEKGFGHVAVLAVGLVLAVVVLTGLMVAKHQQRSPQNGLSTTKAPSVVQTSKLAAGNSPQNIASTAPTPTAPSSTATTQTTTTPTTKTSTPPPAVVPAPTVVHPTIANCKGAAQPFTVYASNPAGTPAYGMPGGTEAGKVHYTVQYKDAITRVYCDSSNGREMVYHLDDGATGTYSTFYYSDLSLIQP
jgi:cytoskeletal protein RodZ